LYWKVIIFLFLQTLQSCKVQGALAILSGCLPGVTGVYAGNEVFPNVFSFAIAPAASGKGALIRRCWQTITTVLY
jgi:hypothetical protein